MQDHEPNRSRLWVGPLSLNLMKTGLAHRAISSLAALGLLFCGHARAQIGLHDGSTNLVQWVPFFTNPTAFGAVTIVDSNASNFPWRYYRAVTPSTP